MCITTSSTAEVIYSVMDAKLSDLLRCVNPWAMCTSVGVDNTAMNIGIRNSLKSRILQFNGCPCHVLHNAAQKAGNTFATYCKFDAEEFDKSTNRKMTCNPTVNFVTKSIYIEV